MSVNLPRPEAIPGIRKAAILLVTLGEEVSAELLRQLAVREGISLEQTIAVGDGANDLLMLGAAGLGIAFRAKPLVRASAKQSISQLGLDGILYLMGISDQDARGRLRRLLDFPAISRRRSLVLALLWLGWPERVSPAFF